MDVALRDWREAGRLFPFRGCNYFYRCEGRGEPVLLLHGLPGGSWEWHRVLPVLAQRHRVIAPDRLGCGLSDKPSAYRYCALRDADALEALLRELGVEAYSLIAAGAALPLAQELLARHRDRERAAVPGPAINRVNLISPPLAPGRRSGMIMRRLLLGAAAHGLPFDGRRAHWLRTACLASDELDPVERRRLEELVELGDGLRLLPRLLREESGRYTRRRLDAVRDSGVPVALVLGCADKAAANASDAGRLGPVAVEWLEGAGTVPQLQTPERLVEALTGQWPALEAAEAVA